jgi:hypothetical protein
VTSCAAVWPADVDSTASRIHTVAVSHTVVAVAVDTCLAPQRRIEPCVEVGMDSSTVAVGSGPGRASVHPMAAAVVAEEEHAAWNAETAPREDSCKNF